MSDIKVKVEVGYGTTVAESEDPRLCAKIMTLILDHQAEAESSLTPEQTAIKALESQLEEMRSDLSTQRYYRENAEKKVKELEAKVPSEETV